MPPNTAFTLRLAPWAHPASASHTRPASAPAACHKHTCTASKILEGRQQQQGSRAGKALKFSAKPASCAQQTGGQRPRGPKTHIIIGNKVPWRHCLWPRAWLLLLPLRRHAAAAAHAACRHARLVSRPGRLNTLIDGTSGSLCRQRRMQFHTHSWSQQTLWHKDLAQAVKQAYNCQSVSHSPAQLGLHFIVQGAPVGLAGAALLFRLMASPCCILAVQPHVLGTL